MENITIEDFKVIGISVRTSNADGQALNDISALWNRFMAEQVLSKIPNKVDDTIYSLYTQYVSDHNEPYTTIIGCKVTDINTVPEGMVAESFEGGKYVKMTAKGDLQKGLIGEQWYKIWNMDLNRRYTVDFEVFGEKAQNPADAEVDFLVAVD